MLPEESFLNPKDWQKQGEYEYEFDENGYTGWFRSANERIKDGNWPEWNLQTGETR